ncbi:MAG: Asp-tRNA(Asn)/Glu-tRNA(Gln) amidotransferase subunit GatC [Gammaproteobacteria bacterium]
MAITIEQFKHIVQLAYLDPEDVADQLERCSATIKAIEQLQIVDTTRISPLHHPTSITQYLRPDSDVILPDVNDLAKNAPTFIDNFYTVPLIIKGQ